MSGLYQLKQNFHSVIAFTKTNLNDSCVTTVTSFVFRSDLCKQFVYHVYLFCVFLLSCCFCRNFCYRVQNFQHLTTSVQSGRIVFFDFFLYFIVYSYFLAVYDFFYSLTVFVFTCYFSSNGNSFEVVFFFNSQSDQTFCNFADFFIFLFCSNDFSMIQQRCNLSSDQGFSLVCCSSEFSITCHFIFLHLWNICQCSSGLLDRCCVVHNVQCRDCQGCYPPALYITRVEFYSSLGLSCNPSSFSLPSTSSSDLRPRLRTFIISSGVLLQSSSTVLIPALFRQL